MNWLRRRHLDPASQEVGQDWQDWQWPPFGIWVRQTTVHFGQTETLCPVAALNQPYGDLLLPLSRGELPGGIKIHVIARSGEGEARNTVTDQQAFLGVLGHSAVGGTAAALGQSAVASDKVRMAGRCQR